MASEEVVLKVQINAEINRYSIMFMLRERKAGENYSLKMGRKSFEELTYLKNIKARILKNCRTGMGWESVDRIRLARDRDKWTDVVKAVNNA